MILHIAPNRTISDIQNEFNREFAFLKLEFFNKKALLHADYSDGLGKLYIDQRKRCSEE